jgi:hypothetical protein
MPMERTMKRTLIRYKTKPEAADRNAGLIAKVFEELKAAKPDGLRYLSLRLALTGGNRILRTRHPAGRRNRPMVRARA